MKEFFRMQSHTEVTYTVSGKTKVFSADLSDGKTACNGEIELRAETSGNDITVYVRNCTKKDIVLGEICPCVTDSIEIDGKICAFLQKRHKNDLPGSFLPSRHDDSFGDMCRSLSESGSEESGKEKSEFSADSIAVLHTENGSLLLAFLTGRTCLLEINCRFDGEGNVLSFEMKNEFHCILRAGSERKSETVRIAAVDDADKGILDFAREKAKLYGADPGKKAKPSVWCSWSYYAEKISPSIVRENMEMMKKRHIPYTCVQLDDGWEKMYGDWEDNDEFASDGGIRALAKDIKKNGYIAGIWTCPLIVDQKSSVAREHNDWLLRRKNGERCIFEMVDENYFVLDPTVPEVLLWIRELYRHLTFDLGYTYHKTDFTRAVIIQDDALFANPEKTSVEAYVSAISAAREGMGENAYFVMCGGLYDALIGIVDAERTGSDVMSLWLDPGSGKPKIPYTVKQNAYRAYMNEWWHNDPDSMMVRVNSVPYLDNHRKWLSLGTLTEEEAKTFTSNQYFGGGLVCSTENLSEISDDRLLMLRHIMPPVSCVSVLPMGTWDGERFPTCLMCEVKKDFGTWRTFVFVNWSDEEKDIVIDLSKLSFEKEADEYTVSGFYSGKTVRAKRGDNITLGVLAPHGSEIVKVAEVQLAQIVKSNMHYSFGGELDDFSFDEKEIHFAFKNRYDFTAKYGIMLCGAAFESLPDGVIENDGIIFVESPPLSVTDIVMKLK